MIVGTAGHIDHGKSALVRALTGTDPDRLADEKARGISIELGFAYADLGAGTDPAADAPAATAPAAVTGFVDVPGHERLIDTMLAGAGAIDLVLLVVAADDGVMPQTREHVAILDLLGHRRGIVALTKADLAGPEQRAEVAAQVRGLLAGTGLAQAPVLEVSARTGAGIGRLRAALADAALQLQAGNGAGAGSDADADASASASVGHAGAAGAGRLFRFAVDRCFTLAGTGTVVTGTVLDGRVVIDDPVMVSPAGLPARVRGIHANNRKSGSGRAGQRCALNLAGEAIHRDAIRRGDLVVAPARHAPATRIDAELTVLAGEPAAIGTWFPVRLHSQTLQTAARVVPLVGPVPPGGTGLVQLVLARPVAAQIGDRFVLRDTSARRTLGGGVFLDLRAPSRRRGTAARRAWLAAAQPADPVAALSAQAALAPVALPVFLRDRGLSADAMTALVAAAGVQRIGEVALSAAMHAGLRAGLHEALAAFHREHPDLAGIGREQLRLALTPVLPRDAFLVFLRSQADAGAVAADGAFLHQPGHRVNWSAEDETLWRQLQPHLLGEARFRPPRVRDLAGMLAIDEERVRRVLRLSQRLGHTEQVAHDHFFARPVVREMVAILVDIAAASPDGWFIAADLRDRLHNGRKVAIQILDFFDRLGLTRRRGDRRRLNPHRLDLYDN